ncbi:MAG TPA: DUF6766 family protein [Gaiellaceae bacterium]|nr:DUF6766 family protein [Gaiellaceae bacterium]
MRTWLRDQSLSLFFLVLFVASLAGQSYAGYLKYNDELSEHGDPLISWGRYVVSSEYGQAVMENWQSEFLQFLTFIAATIWLVQRGSNESKQSDEIGLESDQAQRVKGYADDNSPAWAKARDVRLWLYSNSLLIVMALGFFGSWFASSVTAWTDYNANQIDHQQPALGWWDYVLSPDFWERTLQNWQSEFLAVGVMAAFTIYLRQRGSPESKPVGAPHEETGTSG